MLEDLRDLWLILKASGAVYLIAICLLVIGWTTMTWMGW